MSDEPIGETLARRYRILQVIGRGGLGTVYKALDTRVKRPVALKVLHVTPDGEAKQRFLKEADVLARLNHPNIVQIYDEGEAEGLLYLAVEYIEGRSLQRIVAEGKSPGTNYAIEIIRQVGTALGYAHQRGVVHRDVKPSNILISNQGRVLLTDFGLAIAPGTETLTNAGTIAGTLLYMSPEQAMGKRLDGRSDLFSLGVVLYELLTGRHPFSGVSLAQILSRIVEQEPLPPEQLNSSLSLAPSLGKTVLKALAKAPEQRFQTAEQFVSALAKAVPAFQGLPACDEEPTLRSAAAPPSAVAVPPSAPLGRTLGSKLSWLVAALIGVLVVSFVVVSTRPVRPASPGWATWFNQHGLSLLVALSVALALWFLLRFCLKRASRKAARFQRQDFQVRPGSVSTGRPRPGQQSGRAEPGPILGEGAKPAILPAGEQSSRATSGSPTGTVSDTLQSSSKLYGTKLYRVDEIQDAPTDPDVIPYTPARLGVEISKPGPSITARLLMLNGPMRGRQFRLRDTFTIGSAPDCDLTLAGGDPVARHMAKMCLESGRFYIYRSGSGGDTLVAVNGIGAQRQELRDRDEIQIDRTIMLFIQGVNAEDLTVEAKRRLLEFDSTWDELTRSVRDG